MFVRREPVSIELSDMIKNDVINFSPFFSSDDAFNHLCLSLRPLDAVVENLHRLVRVLRRECSRLDERVECPDVFIDAIFVGQRWQRTPRWRLCLVVLVSTTRLLISHGVAIAIAIAVIALARQPVRPYNGLASQPTSFEELFETLFHAEAATLDSTGFRAVVESLLVALAVETVLEVQDVFERVRHDSSYRLMSVIVIVLPLSRDVKIPRTPRRLRIAAILVSLLQLSISLSLHLQIDSRARISWFTTQFETVSASVSGSSSNSTRKEA
ncbi:hypothetical protein CP532_3064 [Ophiocordyceps camponoti-leonardi (nom. inval.)]|nr:hypothetical protein CP532_3064 [Ophiocordyceps camponoti-leonardi (nom. inval.)]